MSGITWRDIKTILPWPWAEANVQVSGHVVPDIAEVLESRSSGTLGVSYHLIAYHHLNVHPSTLSSSRPTFRNVTISCSWEEVEKNARFGSRLHEPGLPASCRHGCCLPDIQFCKVELPLAIGAFGPGRLWIVTSNRPEGRQNMATSVLEVETTQQDVIVGPAAVEL
ncbi:hypothetical protein EJ06DRAFT_523508 [Trichodelitschia bisporula]|uniref:Uncharacterized protein n=1 Tax=Trichodelitschia bisporula TaxID=703511 RepID=A0A6G1HQK7_9PEZI|nr:hypothetical protein EJ06DRAFT_523508 [Trichodelitschia bisporula]